VLGELEKYIHELKQDTETKFVVFHAGRVTETEIGSESAECSGYFSTGANVREMSELSKEEALAYSKYGQSIMKSISDLDQVTIAVIPRGFCVGGGLELSTSCDFRVANEGSVFQMPERKLGIIPGWGGTQNIASCIGAEEAERWISNGGKTMRAKRAYELGLIDYLLENPLGETNGMIKNKTELVSRSKHDPEKMVLDGVKIKDTEVEAKLFAESWNHGTPKGIIDFLEEQKGKETPEQKQERVKEEVSKFLEDKFVQVAKLKKESLEKGEETDVVELLKEVWPENDGQSWQRKPVFSMPGLSENIRFKFDLSSDYDDANKIMTLDISRLRGARTPVEVDNALDRVIMDAYHEAEHIYNPGSDDAGEGVEETVAYLSDSGEIEAHARGFMYIYKREFPNQQFDIENAKVLATQLKEKGITPNYYNYLISFSDPEKQEKYKPFGDVKAVNQKFIEVMKKRITTT
jgi:enoyl-CoA hydratase/carnithine racemase